MVNFKEDEQLKMLNHSCAHLMAQAINISIHRLSSGLDLLLQKVSTMMWIWVTM